VTIDYPKEKGTVTVAVRYSGLATPSADAALMTCYGAGTYGTQIKTDANRSGVCLRSTGQAGAVYTGKYWYDNKTGVPVAFPSGSAGRFAYCYYLNSNDSPNRGGYFLSAAGGTWSQLAKWGNIASVDYGNITGCAIGGPRNQNLPATGAVGCLKGMIIEEVAVFQGVLTAAELDEAFPPSSKRPLPLPVLKYAAADAVTDASGNVTSWPNVGTAASADLTAKGTGLTVGTGRFGSAPVVHFPGGDTNKGVYAYLQTATASTYGLDDVKGATIFEVYTLTNDMQYGSWGIELAGGVRCWEDTANNNVHRWMWFSPGTPLNSKITRRFNSPLMITCTAGRGNSIRMAMFDGGKYSMSGNHAGSVSAGKFALGSCCHAAGGGYLFGGDIAEFRLYDRELSAAEQFQVECELAEKYSMSIDPDGESSIAPQLLKSHVKNPVVLGTFPAVLGGGEQGVVLNADSSGDLTVGFVAAPAAAVNSLLYVAGNGAATASGRTWAFAGAAGARAVPLTLTFTGADYVGLATKELYCRASAQHQWRRVRVPAEITETAVSFTLPAGWDNAQYGVFASVPRETPTLWFRAEDAVTDADGNVTSLPNVGTLSAEIPELKPTTVAGAGTIKKTSSAGLFNGRPFVELNKSHLLSDGTTDLGIANASQGVAWFIVYRRLGGDGNDLGALFGLGSADNALRFTTFFGRDTQQGNYIRSSFLSYTACDVPLDDGMGILSVSGFERTGSARMDGVTGRTVAGWWPSTAAPWAGKVYLGLDGLPWSEGSRGALWGDIAEFRLYNHALSATERATIELELANKYGLPVQTVGSSFDAAESAAHDKDALLLGSDPAGGPSSPVETTWNDEVLRLSFATAPAANVRSLMSVGSNGAGTAFVPRVAGSVIELVPRTWYVSSAVPGCGGVFAFSYDTSDANKFTYRLYRKADAASDYVRMELEPVIGDGTVTFTLGTLEAGSYRLERQALCGGTTLFVR